MDGWVLQNETGGPFVAKALAGHRAILKARSTIETFRSRFPDAGGPLSSVGYYLDLALAWDRLPVAVLVSRSGSLTGIVLFSFRSKFGIPVGLAVAGNPAGQGGVIADRRDRQAVIEAACKAMLTMPAVHTVLCSAQWDGDVTPGTVWPVPEIRGDWCFRETRMRLSLEGGVDATMERLGYKMRRNIRSYRRRLEASDGCRFVSDLNAAQRRAAVSDLHKRDVYTHSSRRALRHEAVLSRLPGAFAMGAQDNDGSWLSYISGWRMNGDTNVVWQLNDAQRQKSSMSTVMRSYLIEHEVERGSLAIVFIGGVSALWARACAPTTCGDLLAVRPGLVGTAARRLAELVSPDGQIARLHAQSAQARSSH